MKIIPIEQVKVGMRIAQNIYRHDGLLAFQSGDFLDPFEVEEIKQMDYKFLSIVEKREHAGINCADYLLTIIEKAYTETSVIEHDYGKKLFDIVKKHIRKNEKLQESLHVLREKASYFFVQSINTSLILAQLLYKKNKTHKELEELGYILFLIIVHDVGMGKEQITYDKHGKIDEGEFKLLVKHPMESQEILRKSGIKENDMYFVIEHHEKYDGTGYPYKLQKEEISELGQLVHIANFYNDLVQLGPDKKMIPPHEVYKELEEEKARSFHPIIVKYFLSTFTPYTIGTTVELTNYKTAVVKEYKNKNLFLPIVEVINDVTGETEEIIDLSKSELSILHVLD